MEKFLEYLIAGWTINLKSFEIIDTKDKEVITTKMNYKLEKFWNSIIIAPVNSLYVNEL